VPGHRERHPHSGDSVSLSTDDRGLHTQSVTTQRHDGEGECVVSELPGVDGCVRRRSRKRGAALGRRTRAVIPYGERDDGEQSGRDGRKEP
jgi:hypothetical protein